MKQSAQLRDILDRNRLAQVLVAREIGVSRVSVGNWVNGHRTPTGDNLAILLAFIQRYEPSLTMADLLKSVPQR